MLSIMCFKHKSFLKKLPCIEAGNALGGAPEVTVPLAIAEKRLTSVPWVSRLIEFVRNLPKLVQLPTFKVCLSFCLCILHNPCCQSTTLLVHDTYIVASMRMCIEVKAIKLDEKLDRSKRMMCHISHDRKALRSLLAIVV